MGIGNRRGGASKPLLKYDARVGRFYKQDRVYQHGEWQSVQDDVTDNLNVVFDLAGFEVGWIAFPKGAPPDCVMFPIGEDIGEPPSEDHRQGLRVTALIPGDDAGARELISTAVGIWNAFDELHDDYLEGMQPGKLPVVTATDFHTTKNKSGGVSVEPVFSILEWIDRPEEFPALVDPKPVAARPKLPAKPVAAKPSAGDLPAWMNDADDPGAEPDDRDDDRIPV
jgi:hypothetical protein